ncbi:MAG TPA: hypothetical protein VK943_19225, partial [Arenibaculum sp.]|nr:hypothetical protein [Arenibaculum sp.]
QLLSLLSFAPARIALAGVWSDWEHAGTADVSAFLRRWRDSRFAHLRAGHSALRDLAIAAWYANPDAWPAIGYPGPPEMT